MSDLPKQLGKYPIQSVLGQGAMGVVYKGLDPDIQRPVAIKVMHAHLQNSREGAPLLERFRREAQAAARCSHPNIVTVYELGRDADCDFIVMEYVQGAELRDFLDRGRRFTPKESLYIAGEVLKGLDAAHRHGIVHRDVKPANIILLRNGGVKVADFGVARTQQSELTVSGHMVGTPAYMSPEGLQGREVDHRSDIYSLGMVLLELLTGVKPTPQERYSSPMEEFLLGVFRSERGSRLSAGHRYLLHRSLVDDPARRFPDAKSFLQSVEKVQAGLSEGVSAVDTLTETFTRGDAVPTADGTAFTWTDALLQKLETELAVHLGPLAGVLIRKASSLGYTPDELVDYLARHIKDQAERDLFLEKARHCMAVGSCGGENSLPSGERSAPGRATATGFGESTVADTVPPEQLERLAKALARHVGPLASQLVNRHARRAYALDELHRQLAATIPNPEERQEFMNTVSG